MGCVALAFRPRFMGSGLDTELCLGVHAFRFGAKVEKAWRLGFCASSVFFLQVRLHYG